MTLPGNPGNGINRPGGGGAVTLPGNRPGGGFPGNGNGNGNGNRPNFPGLGERPVTLPGVVGNRPGGGGHFPGEVNRPGINRPGGGGNNVVNRPGGGNIVGGGNNIGSGGNNVNVSNRPVNINTNVINNNFTSNNFTNVSNVGNRYGGGNRYVDHGGWFGGNGGYYGNRWGGGGWGGNYYRPGHGGYYGGWGGGWARPYYGNWYRGSWGSSSAFWTGFGVGALTGFGVNALFNSYPSYGYTYAVGNYFPTWSVPTYTTWGLTPLTTSVYSGYANPYYVAQPVVAAQPVEAAPVYDYSQPIVATGPPPEPAVTETAEGIFGDARNSFIAGDYNRALAQVDQALRKTSNVPVMHEFRALTLFALKRYDEAAAVAYAVLSAGPGWNWSTLVGLYPDVETYTNQLRALEAQARTRTDSAPVQFLLAYHYMVQGHSEEAAAEFQTVAELQPKDALSSSFAKALSMKQQIAANAVAQLATAPTLTPAGASDRRERRGLGQDPNQAAAQDVPPPPPPPEAMAGQWKAAPGPGVQIALSLEKDGAFKWEVDENGKKQTLEGRAGFQDGMLALDPGNGPPLVGKVVQTGDTFTFRPSGVPESAPSLTFKR
ncbi:MAG: tetratricopeptide repeat protein [Isosphaeraceae bacterium]